MLPSFRLLLATIVLSAGVLVFGLGAAALLRAAHEEFITIPAWREAQKPVPQLPPLPPLALASDVKPVLAMLRIEPTVTTPSEIALPDPPKVASVTSGMATDAVVSEPEMKSETTPEARPEAKPDTPAETKAEASAPVRPHVRRAARARLTASIRRQRAIARARAARLAQIRLQQQQQQQFNADPFRFFLSPNTNGT